MNSNLFFIGSLIVLIVGSFLDIRSSLKFPYYGATERIPFWRDKYGFFSLNRHLIAFGIFIAVMIAAKFLWFGNQVGIVFYIIGGARIWAGIYNERGLKENRIEQIRVLTRLDELADTGVTDPSAPEIDTLLRKKPITKKADRAFYKLFGWLHVPNSGSDYDIAIALRNKLIAHAQKAIWFPQ